MILEYGQSANGRSTYVRGGKYYVNFELPCLEPIIAPPLPAKLAWTTMNTGWNNKRGKK